MRFRALPPPDEDEVRRVVERLARRGDRIDPEDLSAPATPRCAAAVGFTLHADVAVSARDRRRLERLCRYVARPPVATDRLERLPDGRLLYHLRHRWRDGTTQIVFEPHQLLARWFPSSRPPARTRSAITACLPPAPAGAIGWSRRGLTQARPPGPPAPCAAMPGRICCAVCSRWTCWNVPTAAGGCDSSPRSIRHRLPRRVIVAVARRLAPSRHPPLARQHSLNPPPTPSPARFPHPISNPRLTE